MLHEFWKWGNSLSCTIPCVWIINNEYDQTNYVLSRSTESEWESRYSTTDQGIWVDCEYFGLHSSIPEIVNTSRSDQLTMPFMKPFLCLTLVLRVRGRTSSFLAPVYPLYPARSQHLISNNPLAISIMVSRMLVSTESAGFPTGDVFDGKSHVPDIGKAVVRKIVFGHATFLHSVMVNELLSSLLLITADDLSGGALR